MNITLTNQHGERGLVIPSVRTFHNQHAMIMLNKQINGGWHFLCGKRLVPVVEALQLIRLVDAGGHWVIEFVTEVGGKTFVKSHDVKIKRVKDKHPYLHIEHGIDGFQLIVTENLLMGNDLPVLMEFNHG